MRLYKLILGAKNFEEVQKCFNELTYKEKIRVYCDLLPFGVSHLRPAPDNALERLTDKELAELYVKLKIAAKETVKDRGIP